MPMALRRGAAVTRADRALIERGLSPARPLTAGDDGNARRQRAHRAPNIVRKPDDARGFDAWRGLELIECDDGSRMRLDDLAAHAEILQHAFKRARIGFELALAQRLAIGGLR